VIEGSLFKATFFRAREQPMPNIFFRTKLLNQKGGKKVRFFKLSLKLLMVLCVLLLFTTQARALRLRLHLTITTWKGLQNNMSDIPSFLATQGIPDDAELLYKSNVEEEKRGLR